MAILCFAKNSIHKHCYSIVWPTSQPKIAKNLLKPTIFDFKVIDVGIPEKLGSSACHFLLIVTRTAAELSGDTNIKSKIAGF